MKNLSLNPAASVDAPIAFLASSWRFRRRATEQQRYLAQQESYALRNLS
jgi:hypothetical protein